MEAFLGETHLQMMDFPHIITYHEILDLLKIVSYFPRGIPPADDSHGRGGDMESPSSLWHWWSAGDSPTGGWAGSFNCTWDLVPATLHIHNQNSLRHPKCHHWKAWRVLETTMVEADATCILWLGQNVRLCWAIPSKGSDVLFSHFGGSMVWGQQAIWTKIGSGAWQYG